MLALKFNCEGHMGIYRNYPWGQTHFGFSEGRWGKDPKMDPKRPKRVSERLKKSQNTYFKSK